MIEIHGEYNTAVCYCDELEESARKQIQIMCDTEALSDSKIRIMPDVHAGKACTIGTTMTITDKAVPNLVGVDIGCGMFTVNLGRDEIDLAKFDEAAHFIPSGCNVWSKKQREFDLSRLICGSSLNNPDRIEKSLGTLGGGNHFIEIDRSEDGTNYLIIHTGSRNLGKQVADLYQRMAVELEHDEDEKYLNHREELIRTYKEQGRQTEIEEALKGIKREENDTPEYLCGLTGRYFDDYIHDLKICQEFAKLNREIIAEILLERSGLKHTIHELDSFHTTHNYIDTDEMILRKGAIAAHSGERVLIPMNMRDGALICSGKGNPDWNYSAPHGAGRILSRSEAKEKLTLEEFRASMNGIYTTCIDEGTLDESPMAYKNPDAILKYIGETVDVISQIKPVYNFKASEKKHIKQE